jgi:hypothetical protein
MENYNVNYTDTDKTPITIQEGTENNTTLDVAVFGNTFLEYGQELNENILHLLENFSCPMNIGNTINNAAPDTHSANGSYNVLLSRPTEGQIWYNSTVKKLYYWDGAHWRPITTQNDVAANWGLIGDGFQLPKPVSATTGYVFPYSECIWSVSPANFGGTFDYMACATDSVATVNMKYRIAGGSMLSGVANYLIIGIRGNTNHGTGFAMTPPVPSATPTSTPIPPSATASGTPAASVTPTASNTPFPSGTIPPTPSQTPSHTPTRTRTPTGTPGPSASPSNTPVLPTPTASNTPAAPTPTSTPIPPTPTASPVFPLTLSHYGPTSTQLFGCASWPGSGHTLTATTGVACGGGSYPDFQTSVTAAGGIPPYTYQWQYVSGSTAFAIDTPTSSSTIYRANGTTPTPSGGHCDGCTDDAGVGCPAPEGTNVTCAVVRCKVTDSVGTIIYSPLFSLTFYYENTV